tara:strand:- start:137 stop:430 length:294 start_codon:yes stop_codon:yes gene_type:complete
MRYGKERWEYVQETLIETDEITLDYRGYCIEEDGIVTCDYIQIGLMPREALISKPPSIWWVPRGGAVSDQLYEQIEQSREDELEELRHGSNLGGKDE